MTDGSKCDRRAGIRYGEIATAAGARRYTIGRRKSREKEKIFIYGMASQSSISVYSEDMNKPTLLNKTEQAAIYKVADLLNHYKGTDKARIAAHDLRVLIGPNAIAQLTEDRN